MPEGRSTYLAPWASIGGIARSTALVAGAALVAQAAGIIASPLLSRLYDPDAFGTLAMYLALLMVLVSAASFRYDLAIPIAASATVATSLVALCLVLTIVFAVGVAAVLILAGGQVAELLGVQPLGPYLWLLPLGLLIASTVQALSGFASYRREYAGVARMRTTQGVSMVILQVGLGLIRLGPIGLILGDLVSRAVGVDRLLRSLWPSMRGASVTPGDILAGARHYWGFARVMTAVSVLGALSLQVPFLLLPLFFDLSVSGQFFMAYRVLILPAALLGTAVSQVFFGEASHMKDDPASLRSFAFDAAVSLLVFSIPTYAILAMAGPFLFSTILGADWRQAGEFARVMAPWLLLWGIASPLSSLLLVGRRERESFLFATADLILRTSTLVLGGLLHSVGLAIAALTLASAATYLVSLWRILRVASIGFGDLAAPVARIIVSAVIPILCLGALMLAYPADGPPLLLVGACGVAWLAAITMAAHRSTELRAMLVRQHD